MPNPPQTVTRTSHALTIKTSTGLTIGMIKTWNPQQGRAINPVFEINVETSGDPIEKVPGNMQNLQIRVQRYDLYTRRMEEAFGSGDVAWLSDQDRPFSVQELWRKPDNSLEAWLYTGCWFASAGRNLQSDDNRIVLVDATLEYVHKTRIQ